MKRHFVLLTGVIMGGLMFLLSACGSTVPNAENSPVLNDSTLPDNTSDKTFDSDPTVPDDDQSSMTEQTLLGGLSPEEALEYIKNAPDTVIVQVNTAQWKIEPGFTGALWIPHDEMESRYDEIPEDCPVILHCGAGVVSVPAYETLIEKRPDIPELSYIAGSPHQIMQEYNEWLEKD